MSALASSMSCALRFARVVSMYSSTRKLPRVSVIMSQSRYVSRNSPSRLFTTTHEHGMKLRYSFFPGC